MGPPWPCLNPGTHFRCCIPFVGIWICCARMSVLPGLRFSFLPPHHPALPFCVGFFFWYCLLDSQVISECKARWRIDH